MRLTAAISAMTFAVICTSLAATRQTEPLAEQQFKNIVSFKGQKASDVIPAMQFMDASLKVQCTYCHVEDRSSDEKGEKKTAREMIAMQKDINDKNFRGRTVVTCATCHAGHTRPINVPPIVGLDIRTRRSTEVAPEQVLMAYAKALGTATSAPTAIVHLTGTSTSNGVTTNMESVHAGPKLYLESHTAKGDQKQGFDGTMVWFTEPTGVQRVPLEYAIQFVRQNSLFLTPESLPKQESPTGGTAKIDGKDTVVVTGTIVGSKARASYFFDKATGLLTRSTFFYPTVLGSIEQINDYSNYRKVGGLQIPMKITNHSPEGDTIQEFKSVKVDTKGDASIFDPPK